jgi:hypothetical protein
MEIREIVVPEVNSSVDLPQVAIPQAPPITLEIGVPVIDLPTFEPLDMEPEVEPPEVVLPKRPAPPPPQIPPVKLPKKEEPAPPAPEEIPEPKVEVKSLPQQIVEAIPTIPQATAVAASSVIGVSAALATPFLLKLIKPTIKKVAKKLQKALGKKVKVESVYERRKFQRSLRR